MTIWTGFNILRGKKKSQALRHAVFCRPSGPDNQLPDRVRINMRVDFWERAVCRADPITFLWSRLNSCVYSETLFIILLNSTWMYGIIGALNNFARLSFKHTSLPPPKHVNCTWQLQIVKHRGKGHGRWYCLWQVTPYEEQTALWIFMPVVP